MSAHDFTRRRAGLLVLAVLLAVSGAQAQPFVQLPAPELFNVAPLEAQAGTSVEVSLTGLNLDGASQLLFSGPGVHAEVKKDAHGKAVSSVFVVTVAPDAPVGLRDVRMVGKFGISNPRGFWVGKCKEKTEANVGASREKASPLDWDSAINTTPTAGGLAWYRFHATAGQEIHVALQCPDTRLEPVLTLANADGGILKRGRDIYRMEAKAPVEGDYFVEVHDLMFRGGLDFQYRVVLSHEAVPEAPQQATVTAFTTPQEMERVARAAGSGEAKAGNAVLTPPFEKIDLFPANGRAAVIRFRAKKGDRWWIDLNSHRLGYATDAAMVLEEEKASVEGGAAATFVAEAPDFDLGPAAADYNLASRDGAMLFEAKEDATMTLSLRDAFNTAPTSPRLPYHLTVRAARPDFQLVAVPDQPPRQNLKAPTDAYLAPTTLRRGGVAAVRVIAARQDGFAGDIELTAEGLPQGVQCLGATLRADQDSALLTFFADDSAPAWGGFVHIKGRARVGEADVTREAKSATMVWNVADTRFDSFHSRLASDAALGVAAEAAPVLLETEQGGIIEAGRKDKLSLKLKVHRRGGYREPFKIRAMGLGAPDRMVPIDVPADVESATIDLDLGRLGLSAGEHEFVFQGDAPRVKYRKNADEIPALEAEAKSYAAEAQAAAGAQKKAQAAVDGAAKVSPEEKAALKKALAEATQKAKDADKAKADAAKKLADTTKGAEPKDLSYMVWSKPVRLKLSDPGKK